MASSNSNSWDHLYPGPPKDFSYEPFTAFLPLIGGTLLLSGILTAFLAKGKPWHDKAMMFYFVLSAFIHTKLERYYAEYNDTILDPKNDHILARAWRHYGRSDTRWWGQQPDIPRSQYSCMYGLEWLAAWECGPLVILTIILAYMDSPWRWAVQSAAVTAQAYGLFITWLPVHYEHYLSTPVDDPILFYGYYWAMQAPWGIVPVLAVIQSGWETSKIFAKLKKLEGATMNGKKH